VTRSGPYSARFPLNAFAATAVGTGYAVSQYTHPAPAAVFAVKELPAAVTPEKEMYTADPCVRAVLPVNALRSRRPSSDVTKGDGPSFIGLGDVAVKWQSYTCTPSDSRDTSAPPLSAEVRYASFHQQIK
jgi:hypothetical protein